MTDQKNNNNNGNLPMNAKQKSELVKQQTREINQKKIMQLLTKMKGQIKDALPKHMTPDRMVRIALTQIRKTPALLDCDPLSVIASIMVCSQLGLEIGVLGHAYLVPYARECQFILGYKGMIELARRSGQMISISAHCVYSKDTFEYEYGINEVLKHVPSNTEDGRGEFVFAYALAKFVGGGYQFEVLTKRDIDEARKMSKATYADSPWNKWFDEMARKTAIRRLFKYLPVSVEVAKAISFEERLESDKESVIDLAKEEYNIVDDFWSSVEDEEDKKKEEKSQAEDIADML